MTPQQIEALKLALEALQFALQIGFDESSESQIKKGDKAGQQHRKAITAIKEALAQPEQEVDWEKLYRLEVKKKEALAAKYERDIKPLTKIVPMAQPEQEPAAWIHNFIEGGISIGKRPADLNRHPDRWTALYKDPKPCPTCEALARTVMLDQTSHDTSPPQRKPLTDEEIVPMFSQRQKQQTEGEKDEWYFYAWGVSDGEAAHNIKENT